MPPRNAFWEASQVGPITDPPSNPALAPTVSFHFIKRVPMAERDWIRVEFRWGKPQHNRANYKVCIKRGGQTRKTISKLDYGKLNRAQQKQLHLFLVRQNKKRATHYEVAWHLAWLLDLSWQQTEPGLTLTERQLRVRQQLLVEPGDSPKDDPVAASPVGVSPLLLCVDHDTRVRLEKEHNFELDRLEAESIQLYAGLPQFDKTQRDFRSRAKTYAGLLKTHYQSVENAGRLVGGPIGDALIEDAKQAIAKLSTAERTW